MAGAPMIVVSTGASKKKQGKAWKKEKIVKLKVSGSVSKSRKSRKGGAFTTKPLPSAFPEFKLFKLKYVVLINHPVGSLATLGTRQAFQLNSAYDIDLTNVGHQPYYFDTLFGNAGTNAPYARYKVVKCSVKAEIFDPTEDGLQFCWTMNTPSDASSIAGSNADVIAERQNSGVVVLNNTGSQKKTMTQTLDIGKMANISSLQFKADRDNFTGGYNSNPNSMVVFQSAISSARASGTGTMMVRYTLVQHIMGYSRNPAIQS